jgi:hypothetical protein
MSDSIVMADTDDPGLIIDRVFRAMAILDAYTASIEDEDAEDRYVLWTVRDILHQVTNDIERIPVRREAT